MSRRLQLIILLVRVSDIFAKFADDPNAELPLCPTNFNYFPQSLPMHCRMPRSADFPPDMPKFPHLPTFPPPFYNSPPDLHPPPFTVPPGFPHLPPGFPPMPPGIPGPFPPGLPGPLPPGMPPPMPMPMPLPLGMPAPHKLPVIVMPFYSPDPMYKKDKDGNSLDQDKHKDKKKRKKGRKRPERPPHDSTDISSDTSDSSSDDDDDDDEIFKGFPRSSRRNNRRRLRSKRKRHNKHKKMELLTPIIQYVTKDGYVIFEKEISKGEASDWLDAKNNEEGEENKEAFPEVPVNSDRENNKDEEINSLKVKMQELNEDKGQKEAKRRFHRKFQPSAKVLET